MAVFNTGYISRIWRLVGSSLPHIGARAGKAMVTATIAACTVLAHMAGSMPATAQQGNLEMLMACSREIGDSAIALVPRSDSICARTAEHPAAWVLESGLAAAAEARSIRLVRCESPGVSVAVTSIGVAYAATDNEDVLERTATIEAVVLVDGSPASSRVTRALRATRRDTIPAAALPVVEAAGYEFTRGTPPPPAPTGFWATVVEPAVVVGSAVVMTILLFTVRSQ